MRSEMDKMLAGELYRVDDATTEGSGLGLAICHEIVQALEGSIALTNRVQGHKVTGLDAVVRLPLPAPLTDSAPTMQAAQSHP